MLQPWVESNGAGGPASLQLPRCAFPSANSITFFWGGASGRSKPCPGWSGSGTGVKGHHLWRGWGTRTLAHLQGWIQWVEEVLGTPIGGPGAEPPFLGELREASSQAGRGVARRSGGKAPGRRGVEGRGDWRTVDKSSACDRGFGRGRDPVTHVSQRAFDATVSPAAVLQGKQTQPVDELCHKIILKDSFECSVSASQDCRCRCQGFHPSFPAHPYK